MGTLKAWLNSPDRNAEAMNRIPVSYLKPNIFCDFAEVCVTMKYKTSRNCRICLDHLRKGTRNKHKETLEGMYK